MLPINQTTAVLMEQAGNRLLSLDGEANTKLRLFSDKLIQINISDLELNYFILFPGGNLVVKSHCERSPSALISGKLSAFITAASAENSGDAIFTGDLHFSGEISTARRFQEFVQTLEIDWQEPATRLFGDVLGHTINSGIKKAGLFTRSLFSSLRQDIPEYLQEEIRVSPSQVELNTYYEQVDVVRSQTDRLQARIQQLTVDSSHD